jgi:ankyrin repeat protein
VIRATPRAIALAIAMLAGVASAGEKAAQTGAQAPPAAYLLYDSAAKGDYDTVKNLLADDPTLAKLRLEQGATALHAAALSDDPRIVEALIERGAFVDVRGGAQQVTPLFLAAMQNHPAVAEALLEHRADPNTRGKALIDENVVEARPLHLAAYAGGTRLVHVLLAHRAILDARSGSGQTPLDYARDSGNFTTVQVIEAYRRYGVTKARPIAELLIAIEAGDSATVALLLDKNAGLVNLRLGNDTTALHVAAEDGQSGAARALLAHGADAAAREHDSDWTPSLRAHHAGHGALAAELHEEEERAVHRR